MPCFSIENAYGLNMYKGMQIQLRMRVHTYTYIHIYIYIHSIHKPKHGTGIGRKQKGKVMSLYSQAANKTSGSDHAVVPTT